MSIKTLPSANGGPVITALILSIIVHGVLAVLLVTLRPVNDSVMTALFGEPSEPLVIDVIELPPGPASSRPPEHPSFYSDRNRSVDKETWPSARGVKGGVDVVATGRAPSAGPAQTPPQPAQASKGGQSPAGQPVKNTQSSGGDANGAVTVAPSPGADGSGSQTAAAPVSGGGDAKPAPLSPASSPRPGLFPTGERLSELARRYEAEAPKGETGKVLNLNTSELRYQRYLINMKNRIEYLWEYPLVASRNGWQGKLNIEFTIRRDGTVSDVKLVKSSNYPVLDDGAITVLRLAAPFAPFPDDFAVDEITIKGEFVYIITPAPPR
ncbi:MAG: TonB family protein [Deltaproteobacteria bacterium]|nr:TonB family protein [Deltaproteobacteria bacterium]